MLVRVGMLAKENLLKQIQRLEFMLDEIDQQLSFACHREINQRTKILEARFDHLVESIHLIKKNNKKQELPITKEAV